VEVIEHPVVFESVIDDSEEFARQCDTRPCFHSDNVRYADRSSAGMRCGVWQCARTALRRTPSLSPCIVARPEAAGLVRIWSSSYNG
jgi:hypothetical protein